LCDWNIDVKTEEQAAEMDLSSFNTVQNAKALFNDDVADESYDEITTVAELPGVNKEVAELLKANGIEQIQDFVEAYDDNKIEIEGVSKEALDEINKLINDNVEFVEDEAESESAPAQAETAEKEDAEEEYFCPECGAKITLDMTHCPNCGCEFEFEEDAE
jgi:N utilization substance protein A